MNNEITDKEINKYKSTLFNFLERVSKIASWSQKKLGILLIISFVSASWMAYFTAQILGLNGYGLMPVVAVLIIPSLVIYFFWFRLGLIKVLPSKVKEFEGALVDAYSKLKSDGVISEIGVSKENGKQGLIGSLKELLKLRPVISNVKRQFEEIGHPEVISSVIAVANPGFVTSITIMFVIVGAMAGMSLLTSLGYLIFA